MKTVFKNISKIYTSNGNTFQAGALQGAVKIYSNCDIAVSNGIITDIDTGISHGSADDVVDCLGGICLPGFIDSHTHPVFAATRQGEFIDRLKGLSYEEITERGGGIHASIERSRAASADDLYKVLERNVRQFISQGITSFEAKSGYALDRKGELKLLKVLNRYREGSELDIKITYLGGHLLPKGISSEEFIAQVKSTIKEVAEEGLADYFDVWVEDIAFDLKQAGEMIAEADNAGLGVRIHANEISSFGGGMLAEKYPLTSIDHFDFFTDEELEVIARKKINITLLPMTQFSLGTEDYPDVSLLIKKGIPVSLATDFNPGTCYSSNIQFLAQIAFMKCEMDIYEILNALTINPAASLQMAEMTGTIEVGKHGDMVIMDIPDLESMFYAVGMNNIRYTVKNGKIIYRRTYES
ncbi:imidazolonepropionase [bacterium]|nr:imidazolonepropionase [bacterium]